MERPQNQSNPGDYKLVKPSEAQGSDDTLSAEMLQRYLKGLGRCKKQRHRACLSQELHKLISS